MKKKVISLTLGLIFVLQMIMSAGLVFAADAPTVVSVTPSGDNVEKAAIGKITFSTSMDKSTLTSENIIIEDEWGDTITPTSTTVWNDAYTFVADFESDTEYIVTVTTDVKSADGVALADDYEHSFVTGTVNGIENVTPTDSASFSSNTSGNGGTNGSVANIYDGNLKNDFTTFGGTAPKWVKIDLGKAYEIAYVSYIPKSTSYNDSWIGNHSIQVSKTGDDWVTLATTPVYDSSQSRIIEHVVAPIDTEKYQYVRIWRNSAYIACTEIDVYAYQGKPEVERVSLSGDGLSKAAAGKVEFSTAMDRSTLTSENIVITDEWGETVIPTVTSAYDKEFVFVADFKADTEYVVSVSSNVKSSSGVAVSASEHTFATGEVVYGVENVTPELSGFSYKAADHTKNLSAVCDNNLGTLWNTFGATKPASLTADLGKAQDIAYIVYCGNTASQPENYANNMQIQVSNDNATWKDLAVTPTLTANKPGALQWIAVNETGEKFQYVRLTRASNVIYVGEVDIFAYESAPEVVSVTPSGEAVTKAQAGKVTFSSKMDRSTLTSENIVITESATGNVVTPKVTSAYDKAFTFVADFAPNTTYKILVSSNVKSASGLAAIAYEHIFTTGKDRYIAKNVTPELSGFSYKAADHTKNLSAVCDNNLGTLWNTFGATSPASLTADLGEAQDIAYIVYCGNKASDPENYASNMKIQVSNDNATWTDLAITPTLSANKPGVLQWIAVNETGEKFQYVRLTRASNVIYIGEVDIFAYEYEAAPKVTGMSFGENGAKDVEYTSMMRVDFDSVMNRYTLTSENIVVTDEKGNTVPQTEFHAYDDAYVFACDFASKTTYNVTVTPNVKTISGTPVAENTTYTFTTGWVAPVKNVTPWGDAFYTTASGTFYGEYDGAQAIYTGGPNDETYDHVDGGTAWIQTDLGKEMPLAYVSYLARNAGVTAEQYRATMRGSEVLVSNDPEFKTYKKLGMVPEFYSDEAAQKGIFWKFVTETNGESYRYIRIQDSGYVFISELKVFAYQPKIEELTQDDIDQVAKVDEYAVKGSAMYGTVDSGESVTYMVEIDKLTDVAADAKVYVAVYGYNENANRVLVRVVEATEADDIYTVSVNIPSGLEEADVNFFVWGEEQTPLMEKIIKRNF